jgi:hypothetical protein
MSFGLKNVDATYQRAIQTCLSEQIGDNAEAYVNDVVVKTKNPDMLIVELKQTFEKLKKWRWKLNPNKCVFGVPSGQLLRFQVSNRGIEASTKQIQAIIEMGPPHYVKDVQKLTGSMAALNCFISRLSEKGLPFFKLLKGQAILSGQRKQRRLLKALRCTSPHHTYSHHLRNTKT